MSWSPCQRSLTVHAWVYFWVLCSVPLVYMSVFMAVCYWFNYHNFVIYYETRKCDASSFVVLFLSLPEDMFMDFFFYRERGREGERETETETSIWEKHWSVSSCMHPERGSNPQPRYVPWPRIEPAVFLVYWTTFQPTEPPSQGCSSFWKLLWLFWVFCDFIQILRWFILFL